MREEGERRILSFLSVFFGDGLDTTFFLGFELVVKEEEGLLVVSSERPKEESASKKKGELQIDETNSLWQTGDDEHPLTSLIVSSLGDGNLGSRETTDLVDLGSGTSDDASSNDFSDGS